MGFPPKTLEPVSRGPGGSRGPRGQQVREQTEISAWGFPDFSERSAQAVLNLELRMDGADAPLQPDPADKIPITML